MSVQDEGSIGCISLLYDCGKTGFALLQILYLVLISQTACLVRFFTAM